MIQADRYNEQKPQWSLVDFKSLEPLVRVLEYGCTKYSKDNWKKGFPISQLMESLLRHCFKLLEGELMDRESGLSHTGHIMANIMFMEYILCNNPQFDDLNLLSNSTSTLPKGMSDFLDRDLFKFNVK